MQPPGQGDTARPWHSRRGSVSGAKRWRKVQNGGRSPNIIHLSRRLALSCSEVRRWRPGDVGPKNRGHHFGSTAAALFSCPLCPLCPQAAAAALIVALVEASDAPEAARGSVNKGILSLQAGLTETAALARLCSAARAASAEEAAVAWVRVLLRQRMHPTVAIP